MNFTEITVRTTSQMAEVVAYFMQEVSADGVSIYDKNDLYNNPSWDYKDDSAESVYEQEVTVKGYCNVEDTEGVLDFLRQRFSTLENAGSLQITTKLVDGNAWVAKWKETFKPIETEKLVICPEWQTAETNKKVLLLDVGVAFGTGQHETTSMCLTLAENLNLNGLTVLDVGCGSGILGLSALLLNAKNACLVDIDSQAADAAKHNAQINNLTDKCVIKTGNLLEQVSGTFDVVFANLTADILSLLRNDICEVTQKDTIVILSGILDVKLDGVIAEYQDKFTVEKALEKGEWRALLLKAK